MQYKLEEMLSVVDIITFKHVAGISLNSHKETCDQQSRCYQTVLGFHTWLKEMFFNSVCLGIMKNYDESAAVLILAVFVTDQHVDSWKIFWNKSFREFK